MPKLSTVSKSLDAPESKVWRLVNFNPAGFSEFLRSNRRERFRLWPKNIKEINREDLKTKRIQARRLGKSITFADKFISDIIKYRGSEQGIALVGARGQPTLQFIFEQWLIAPFQRNKFLNFFIEPGDRGVDRKNYEVRLRDGTTIKGRIQGKDGQGFNTVHPNIAAWFDEVQLLSNEAVAEIYGMLDAKQKIYASGVPNGVRSSWAYQIDNSPKMGFVGERMTRLDDPNTTEEDVEAWKFAYGGEQTSGYQQKVLGEWGSSSSMTFDMERITADLPFKIDEYPKLPDYYTNREIREQDYEGPGSLPNRLMLSDMPKTAQRIYIHADHGITGSPTTLYVSFYDSKEGLRCWRQFMRVLLFDMQTAAQVDVFHYIADALEHQTKIKPIIGIDTTGQGGQAVMSYLEDMGHPVVWANLSENVEFGTRVETDEEWMLRMKKGPLENPARMSVMMKSPLKQIAIPHLKKVLYTGELRLINQPELWRQFENTTDSEMPNSQDRKYVTDYNGPESNQAGYNHDLQAFEVLGAMLHRDVMAPEVELYTEMWIEEFDTPWGRFDR